MDNRMDEKDAELLRSRSRAAFDAQAPTYDIGCIWSIKSFRNGKRSFPIW